MNSRHLIAMAALLVAGTAAPAFADWNHVGDLQVSPDHYSSVQLGGFTGRVEQIRLRSAGRSDCDNVRVTYEDGNVQDVFAGTLPSDEDQLVTFPDRSNLVKAVSLNCRAANGVGAYIAVAADIPPFPAPAYRPTADYVPAPERDYGPVASYTPPVTYTPPARYVTAPPPSDVQLIASRDFGNLDNQRSLMLDSSEPRAIQAIAIQPVGADARCRNVSALFDDGSTASAMPNDGDNLQEGRLYRAYVGDGSRDLDSINLSCQASNGDHVKINVYAVG